MAKLERKLGLFQTTVAGVGYILGAGIYVLIGAASAYSGNALWMSFVFAALAALLTGLSYAELSSMMPKASGEYIYGKKSLGQFWGFFAAVFMIFSGIFTASSVSIGFSNYFTSIFHINGILLIAAGAIILFSIINWKGISDSSNLNVVCTLIEFLGLIIIILLAFYKGDTVNYLEMNNGFLGILKGASLIFFAFLGYEGIIKLSEETKDPKKNIPRALLLSVIITTVVYAAVAIAAVSILDWQTLAKSAAPLSDVAAAVLGSKAFTLLGIIALFSTANTILMSLVMSSRGIYGLGDDFKRLKKFSIVGKKSTPTNAIVITAIISILFLLLKDITLIAELTNFTVFVVFTLVNLSLIVLRYKQPNVKRSFKVPGSIGNFPVLPALGIIVMVVLLTRLNPSVLIGGAVLSGVLVPVYYMLK